jgi:D-alanyl-lipoteichoic acid acyltransferase DltB (MBOAT superfamily)
MLLAGLWHGAAWTFLIWGALHGSWLVLHRVLTKSRPPRDYGRWQPWITAASIFGTFQLVSFAFVFFRAPDVELAVAVLSRVVHAPATTLATQPLVALFALAVVVHTFVEPRIARLGAAFSRLPVAVQGFAIYWLLAAVLLWGRQGLQDRLFIYFQF